MNLLACIGAFALTIAGLALIAMEADNKEFTRKQTRKP